MPRRTPRRKAALTAHHRRSTPPLPTLGAGCRCGRSICCPARSSGSRDARRSRCVRISAERPCSATVGGKRNRTAVGLDLDREVLAWGAEHNLAPLGDRASSIQLLRQDVRAPCRGRFDVTVALNFSYFVFRTRDDLRGYFEGVRRSVAADGIFVLDAYGGVQSWRPRQSAEGSSVSPTCGNRPAWTRSITP